MVKLLGVNLDDDAAERVRLSTYAAIAELQLSPLVGARVVTCTLSDGVATAVAHGLDRVPLFCSQSIVRGATTTGRIVETRDGTKDRSKFVVLTATGWGGTITLDLLVA